MTTEVKQFNKDLLKTNFEKTVRGFHAVYSKKIELSINLTIVMKEIFEYSKYKVHDCNTLKSYISNIITDFGNILNITGAIDEEYIKHFRNYKIFNTNLNKYNDDIVDKINKIFKKFDYFSFLASNISDDNIHYKWYLIPTNLNIFNFSNYKWSKDNLHWSSNSYKNCSFEINCLNTDSFGMKLHESSLSEYKIADLTLDTSKCGNVSFNYIGTI